MRRLVVLTFDRQIGQFTEAVCPADGRGTAEGCRAYRQAHNRNDQVFCVAEWNDEVPHWVATGYTIVTHNNGHGNAHPWGQGAPKDFREFGDQATYSRAILAFLNKKNNEQPPAADTTSSPARRRRSRSNTASPSGQQGQSPVKPAPVSNGDLDASRRIVCDNLQKLELAYQKKYKRTLRDSDDVYMFFRPDELEKIRKWNERADDINALIDPSLFYEASIGDVRTANLVLLGKNPGGSPREISSFDSIFEEMEERKKEKDNFYPMVSPEAMRNRAWFPMRLIFGKGTNAWDPNCERNSGILYPFIEDGDLGSLCRYASKIVSLELFPYHTGNFDCGREILNEFGCCNRDAVQIAMKNHAVIIAYYSSVVATWCRQCEGLADYQYFYVNHRKKGQNIAEQNGSMSRETLRRYMELNTDEYPAPPNDAYSEIVDLLKAKWKKGFQRKDSAR